MSNPSETSPVVFMGGEIKSEPVEKKHLYPEDILNPATYHAVTEIKAKMNVYLPDRDEVREFELHSPTGHFTVLEPSIEDRRVVDGMMIAEMLSKHEVDLLDFKKIIEAASQTNKYVSFLARRVLRDMEAREDGTR